MTRMEQLSIDRRRVVRTLCAFTALAPGSLRAESSKVPVVGFLNSASPAAFTHLLEAFQDGLARAGWRSGENVEIEYRWAEGKYAQLPALAGDLVERRPDVIAATGGRAVVEAARAATSTIPIVFTTSEPLKAGLVHSIGRPGGRMTGVNLMTAELQGKRLELMRELLPSARSVAVLLNPRSPLSANQWSSAKRVGEALHLELRLLAAASDGELATAFASLKAARPDGLLVSNDPFFYDRRQFIVGEAAVNRIPAVYEFRDFAAAGGLVSYGTDLREAYRQVGLYAGRILNGEKAGDLPVVELSKIELVLNLKTADALRIEIPRSILLRADEVIE